MPRMTLTAKKVQGYLETLRRVPDDIILSTVTRDLDLFNPDSCLCGWVVREHMARLVNKDAEKVYIDGFSNFVPPMCVNRFGGSFDEWRDIFYGVTDDRARLIERALIERVQEAINA